MPLLLPLLALVAAACSRDSAGPGGNNQAPVVTITSPAPGASVPQGTTVNFAGSAADPEDGALTGAALQWSSSVDGVLGTGEALSLTTLSAGNHAISLRATDAMGAEGTADVTLTVTDTAPTPVLRLVQVATGLSEPVFLTAAPGDASRLFVVEKTGAIRIIRDGSLLPAPFLDIGDSVSGGSEQGFLGLAFDPQYATTRRFYVSYTDRSGDSRLARFLVSSGDPDQADAGTWENLLTVDQPASNHNGGMIAFGPDGYLYMSLGDGGGAGDPLDTGQNRGDLLGSLLRLDVSGPGAYAIPAGNPFAGTQFRGELWNWGLRNPWRFSFDRQSGDLYIADVGQNAREEVNVQPAGSGGGENYGWNTMEGLQCYPSGQNCNQTGLTLPVLDYGHGAECSVTGGYVYRGSAIPSLQGHYFYGDYCAGWVRSFRYQNGQAVDRQNRPALSPGGNISSFGEDAAGELYVLVLGGTVYRVVQN